MRCFVHHDTDAVGICRICGKGLCPACAADSGQGLTCQGECEQESQRLRAQILRNRVVLDTQRQKLNRFFLPAFFASMGVVMLFFAWKSAGSNSMGIAMGSVFVAFGLLYAFLQQRLKRAADRDPH